MRQELFIVMIAASFFANDYARGQVVVDFEQFGLPPESFYNGSDLAGGFESSGIHFGNVFTPDFGSWSGFAYSNTTDTTTAGFGNQYSSFFGSGAAGSDTYGVAFVSSFDAPSEIRLPGPAAVESVAITNTTYTALSMLQGDAFAKKFGGEGGSDPDYLRLDILGMDDNGDQVGAVEFYLADFRFADSNEDYVLDQWRVVDLTPLGTNIASLQFAMETTDVGIFGANTPFYFALDNLTVRSVPEPWGASLLLLGVTMAAWWRSSSIRNESDVSVDGALKNPAS